MRIIWALPAEFSIRLGIRRIPNTTVTVPLRSARMASAHYQAGYHAAFRKAGRR
jgi:hypothetical protein